MIASTKPRHEKRAALLLQKLEITSFLPLYRQEHRYSNRTVARIEAPLIPGYIFVHCNDTQVSCLLGLSAIQRMITYGDRPCVLPDTEIDRLKAGLLCRNAQPHPYLTVGDKVRIDAGPFAGFEGVLQSRNRLRVVISIRQIMRSISVEVGADEVIRLCESEQSCSTREEMTHK